MDMSHQYIEKQHDKIRLHCEVARKIISFIGSKHDDYSTRDKAVVLSEKDVSYITELLLVIFR